MKVTNLEVYKEFEAQNQRVEEEDYRNNVYNPYNPYNEYGQYNQYNNLYSSYKKEINDVLDLRLHEDENSMLILIKPRNSVFWRGYYKC